MKTSKYAITLCRLALLSLWAARARAGSESIEAAPLARAGQLHELSGIQGKAEELGPRVAAEKAARDARAAKPASDAKDARWSAIDKKLRSRGVFSPAHGDYPADITLSDVRGDAGKPHRADYVSLWGDGTPADFHPTHASLVSEDWQIPADGNWHIDQWILFLEPDGAFQRAAHHFIVQSMDGQELEDRQERLRPGDPRVKAKLDSLLAQWEAF